MNDISDIEKILRCPLCGKEHTNSKFDIIQETEKGALVYMNCKHCKASVISVLSYGAVGVITVGTLTDLDSDEARKFFNADPITANDIIDFHQKMRKQKR